MEMQNNAIHHACSSYQSVGRYRFSTEHNYIELLYFFFKIHLHFGDKNVYFIRHYNLICFSFYFTLSFISYIAQVAEDLI